MLLFTLLQELLSAERLLKVFDLLTVNVTLKFFSLSFLVWVVCLIIVVNLKFVYIELI
jgi:hypothetical protein